MNGLVGSDFRVVAYEGAAAFLTSGALDGGAGIVSASLDGLPVASSVATAAFLDGGSMLFFTI